MCYCLVIKLCSTLLRPCGLLPGRFLLSMGFPRQEYWSGLPFPPPIVLHAHYNSAKRGKKYLSKKKTASLYVIMKRFGSGDVREYILTLAILQDC